jgi:hypothetical protein
MAGRPVARKLAVSVKLLWEVPTYIKKKCVERTNDTYSIGARNRQMSCVVEE